MKKCLFKRLKADIIARAKHVIQCPTFHCFGQGGSLAIWKWQITLLRLQLYLKLWITLQIFICVSWNTSKSSPGWVFFFLEVESEVILHQKMVWLLTFYSVKLYLWNSLTTIPRLDCKKKKKSVTFSWEKKPCCSQLLSKRNQFY